MAIEKDLTDQVFYSRLPVNDSKRVSTSVAN